MIDLPMEKGDGTVREIRVGAIQRLPFVASIDQRDNNNNNNNNIPLTIFR